MKRNLERLANQKFDVLVVGGGIHGAITAWDAALRGVSVALIERGDFGSGTSQNSLKIIHGGLAVPSGREPGQDPHDGARTYHLDEDRSSSYPSLAMLDAHHTENLPESAGDGSLLLWQTIS